MCIRDRTLPITWKSTLAFLAYLGVIFFADYWEPLYYYRPLPGMVAVSYTHLVKYSC